MHLPRVMAHADVTATHQSRVATRRIKAAINVLSSAIDVAETSELSDRCRRVRRLLGPLRDADVMLEQLASKGLKSKSHENEIARAILMDELKARREKARSRVREKLDVADIELIRGPAMRLCVAVDRLGEVGRLVVRDAVHRQFEAFRCDADRMLGQVKSKQQANAPTRERAKPRANIGRDPLDLHQLRIEGKALRYTLEIGESVADMAGENHRSCVSDRFKPLQDRLGQWHDRVVLGQIAIEWMSEAQVVLHDDERAEAVLKYAATCVRAGRREIARFCSEWETSRATIARAIRAAYPLVKR